MVCAVKYAQRKKCAIVTYEWLDDTILLYDQFKKKAPTSLYHPGQCRPVNEILALYRKKSKAGRRAWKDATASNPDRKEDDGNATKKESENPVVLQEIQRSKPKDKYAAVVEQKNASVSPGNEGLQPNASGGGMRDVLGIPHSQVDHRLYKILKDPTDGFPFKVEICRPDECGNPRGKKWVLQLFESKSTPNFYKFGPVHFEREGARHRHGRGSAQARPKDLAMNEFKDFFAAKTGIKWEERLLRADDRRKGRGYRYHPPAPGESVGYIHPKSAGEADSDALAGNSREPVSSLKRKRGDDSDEARPVKAAKVAHKTAAFDDVRTARTARF